MCLAVKARPCKHGFPSDSNDVLSRHLNPSSVDSSPEESTTSGQRRSYMTQCLPIATFSEFSVLEIWHAYGGITVHTCTYFGSRHIAKFPLYCIPCPCPSSAMKPQRHILALNAAGTLYTRSHSSLIHGHPYRTISMTPQMTGQK